ncbi:MAG: hypothetical protein ACE148_16500 [Vicinamibacterales bacterium]
MADFNIRADSVDVEQIMRQIRSRIREKRGVDYTEKEIEELASARLERFLDPQKVRSDLLEHYRKVRHEAAPVPNYTFEDTTLFETHRAPLRWLRRLLLPVLKLFFNPNPLIRAMHIQSQLNERAARESELTFELVHNLVVELTRTGIEVRNLKMRVEAMSSRLDFDERRARALEGVVQYRSGAQSDAGTAAEVENEEGGDDSEPASSARSRRRRRRRRRARPGMSFERPRAEGGTAGEVDGGQAATNEPGTLSRNDNEAARSEEMRTDTRSDEPGSGDSEPEPLK